MKKIMICIIAIVAGAMTANAAQLYRWVDAKGNVEWRDTPPPPAAKKIEQRRVGDNVISTSEAPFSQQLATKNHPVTLWVTDCGSACTQARNHLTRRGVPFTEKNPQQDMDAFKKLSSGLEIPLLQVGVNKVIGYEQGQWDSALDIAGYPRTGIAVKPAAKPPAAKPAAEPAKAAEAPTGAPPAPAQPSGK